MANGLIAWGVRFAATTYNVRVTDGATTELLTFPATGTLGATTDYYMSGDGAADDLLALFDLTLETHSLVATATSTLSAAFVSQTAFTRSVGTSAVKILWDDALTTLDKGIFGYTATTPLALPTLTGDNQAGGLWRPGRFLADDSRDRTPIVGAVGRAVSGKSRTIRIATQTPERSFGWRLVPQEKVLTEYAASARESFEYGWINSISYGYEFRLYPDEAIRTTSSYTKHRVADLSDPITRNDDFSVRWDVDLSTTVES